MVIQSYKTYKEIKYTKPMYRIKMLMDKMSKAHNICHKNSGQFMFMAAVQMKQNQNTCMIAAIDHKHVIWSNS